MKKNNFIYNSLSEDDIRTKIVYEWLRSSGLSKKDISIEYTIKLQIGRGIKTVHSRTDILVKNSEGQNILIIEVKKPRHFLVDEDKLQALSYARSLIGGIAPFTVLTNGKNSNIYDSISGELINENTVPKNHPYIKSGFIPNADSIKARMEALEYLISFSESNLLTFCEYQIRYRMQPLSGNGINSGKKYIPQLYVERKKAYQELESKLFNNDFKEKNKVILVIGPPQQGKTCFMCNTALTLLKKGHPTLFFSAIGLNKGFLNSIQEDLDWCFNEDLSGNHWIKRLNNIGEKINKQILIFIDGWNEMAEYALNINEECKRLDLKNITIIISTTSPSLQRLLEDRAGNPTYIAENTKLKLPLIRKLMSQPLSNTKNLGIVQIEKFDNVEINEAKNKYGKAFNVNFQNNDSILNNPFYLRIASEQFSEKEIIPITTRTELIRNSLIQKAKRKGIGQIELNHKLAQLAKSFYLNNRPISILKLPSQFQNEKEIELLIESAILTLINTSNELQIDFYYTHDLDYAIANLYKDWPNFFQNSNSKEILIELNDIVKTESGKSALRWFFELPEYGILIEKIFKSIPLEHCFIKEYGRIIIESIVVQTTTNKLSNLKWLEDYINKLIDENNKIEDNSGFLPKLIFSYLKSFNWDKKRELYEFWVRLLLKFENIQEIGIEESYLYSIFDEQIESYDWYLDTKLDVKLFETFLRDSDYNVAQKANYILASSCPYHYLEKTLPTLAVDYNLSIEKFIDEVCELIIFKIDNSYYGDMCPGCFSYLQNGDEEIINEYSNQKLRWFPILKLIKSKSNTYNIIVNFLKDLRSLSLIDIENDDQYPYRDENQFKLKFK